jgi:predicted nucleic acid-binding protein
VAGGGQSGNEREGYAGVAAPGFRLPTLAPASLVDAAIISQQYGLLTNDALSLAVMQADGLTKIASADADFERVPGLTRYASD